MNPSNELDCFTTSSDVSSQMLASSSRLIHQQRVQRDTILKSSIWRGASQSAEMESLFQTQEADSVNHQRTLNKTTDLCEIALVWFQVLALLSAAAYLVCRDSQLTSRALLLRRRLVFTSDCGLVFGLPDAVLGEVVDYLSPADFSTCRRLSRSAAAVLHPFGLGCNRAALELMLRQRRMAFFFRKMTRIQYLRALPGIFERVHKPLAVASWPPDASRVRLLLSKFLPDIDMSLPGSIQFLPPDSALQCSRDWCERLELCIPWTNAKLEREFDAKHFAWFLVVIAGPMLVRAWVRSLLLGRYRPGFLVLSAFYLPCGPILARSYTWWYRYCEPSRPGPIRSAGRLCMPILEATALAYTFYSSVWILSPLCALGMFFLLPEKWPVGGTAITLAFLVREGVRVQPLAGGSILFSTTLVPLFGLVTTGCWTFERVGDLRRIAIALSVVLVAQEAEFRALSMSGCLLVASCACLHVAREFVERRAAANCTRCSLSGLLFSASDLCGPCLRLRLCVCLLCVVISALCVLYVMCYQLRTVLIET